MKNINIHKSLHINKPHSPLLLSTIKTTRRRFTVLMVPEKCIEDKKLVIFYGHLLKCQIRAQEPNSSM